MPSGSTGYSGTPLAKKLGIKPGFQVTLLGAPAGFLSLLEPLPGGVQFVDTLPARAQLVLLFTKDQARLRAHIDDISRAIHPAGALWVAWPKRASKVPTDMTEDVVRAVALPMGLVDNKVCAIDATWSGLRVVWRKTHR